MSGTCSQPKPTAWHLAREGKPSSPASVAAALVLLSVSVLSGSESATATKRHQSHAKMLYPHPYQHPARSCFAPIGLCGGINPLWSTVIPSFQSIGWWTRLLPALLWRWLDKATARLSHRRAASNHPSWTWMIQEERCSFKIKHPLTSSVCTIVFNLLNSTITIQFAGLRQYFWVHPAFYDIYCHNPYLSFVFISERNAAVCIRLMAQLYPCCVQSRRKYLSSFSWYNCVKI